MKRLNKRFQKLLCAILSFCMLMTSFPLTLYVAASELSDLEVLATAEFDLLEEAAEELLDEIVSEVFSDFNIYENADIDVEIESLSNEELVLEISYLDDEFALESEF